LPDARIARTKAALSEAVLKLAGERDFSGVTISDIVAEAGIGYATFFRHYKDKDELLLDVSDQLTDSLSPSILPALFNDDTAEASRALCRHVEANRGACRALFSASAEPQVRRRLTERAAARARTIGLPAPPGLPTDLAITYSVQALVGLLAWWLDHGPHLTEAEMAAIVDRLVMSPVRKGPGERP
jgi:AcrR family transcriptional regulator